MGGYTRELPDGGIVYSASSLGYCSAALYYDRLGVTHEPPPANIAKAWTEGHDNEARILSILEDQRIWKVQDNDYAAAQGFTFGEYDEARQQDYSQQVRVEKRAGGIVVRAHLDGIGTIDKYPPGYISDEAIYAAIEAAEGVVIVEAKAFGDAYWNTWRSGGLAKFPTYEWQVSVQMYGAQAVTGRMLPCVFAVGKKDKDGIVQSVDARLVLTPPIPWGKIAAKIARVEKAVAEKAVPDCEEPIMYPCPFFPMHKDTKVDIFGQNVDSNSNTAPEIKLEGEAAKSVDVFAERYMAHQDLMNNHKTEADMAKNNLLNYLQANGESAQPIVGEKFKVIPKPGGRKGNYDVDKIAKDYNIPPEKLEMYRKAGSTWVSIEIEPV